MVKCLGVVAAMIFFVTGCAGVARFQDCDVCPEMVVVPGGSFEMGGNNFHLEQPVHRVNVRSFALGATEVTQGQWKAVMGNNPSEFKHCGDNCPVERVSWDDVQEYIKKLNQMSGNRYRLPSEAEWEYACRAGERHAHCGGDEVGAVAWHRDNSSNQPHPVGQKQANAWGLYDMSGNVWEWVQDCRSHYRETPDDGSAWEQGGCNWRTFRGGSWNDEPMYTRAADRSRNAASTFRGKDGGFRLARILP